MRWFFLAAIAVTSTSCQISAVTCQTEPIFDDRTPGVTHEQMKLAYWNAQLPNGETNRVLMTAQQIETLNQRNQQSRAGYQDVTRDHIAAPKRVDSEISERQQWLNKRIIDGRLLEEKKGAFQTAIKIMEMANQADELRVIHTETTLHCIPMTSGLFSPPVDTNFNRNRCSGLHPGELVRVLKKNNDQWFYVHAGHSVGWIRPSSTTPRISRHDALNYINPQKRAVVIEDQLRLPNGPILRLGSSFPMNGRNAQGLLNIIVPSPQGLMSVVVPRGSKIREGYAPLTRETIWRLAMSLLENRCGWGGMNGGRDCSRLVMDLFAVFGVKLGRHSGVQARQGVRTIEVSGMNDTQKLQAIRTAGARGIVLLYMPGHIMLYLSDSNNRPFAISSISEYLRPCGSGNYETVRIDKVAITNLELGRHTKRKSFLERLARFAVFEP